MTAARGAGSASRSRPVSLGLLCVAIVLVATLRPWVTGSASDAVLGRVELSGPGQQAAPAAVGAALMGAAGLLTAAISGRVLRTLGAAASVLAGALGAAAAAAVLRDPAGALRSTASGSLARTDTVVTDAAVTAWPLVAAAGSVGLSLVGIAVLVAGRHWGEPTRRYEVTSAAAPGQRESEQTWERLSTGEDPTVDGRELLP